MTSQNGLFIFRRDLRIIDNTSLNKLAKICKHVYPIFIFTPEQITDKNKFKSDNAVQFMIESLESLDEAIKHNGGKLYYFFGDNETIIKKCIQKLDITHVSFNLDITPYAKKRDNAIMKLCKSLNVEMMCEHDYYLTSNIKNGSGDPYQKFTPYYNVARKQKIETPTTKHVNFSKSTKISSISLSSLNKYYETNDNIMVNGGRDNAVKTLKQAIKSQKKYDKTHDDLSYNTSILSPYIKFGLLSIREVYFAFKSNKAFLRQLYWRDFYAQILDNYPEVMKQSLKEKYDKIKWKYNVSQFNAWKKGMTGFPVVDAAMRQLNATGWMHNRGRLIVASFLCKTLLLNWREGERYFAQKLIDYDVPNNNGNWQWVSGGGADSQPYFRIFNPMLQGKEHDPDCVYIKKWVPELKDVPAKDIHNWDTVYMDYKVKYPKPIVDFKVQKDKALAMYEKIF